MKQAFSVFAGVLFIVSFAACNLSKYPIDDPAVVKIDARLLGAWKGKHKHEKSDLYILTKYNDYEYSILARDKKKTKEEHYNGFLSEVGGVRFLNIYSKDDTEKRYLFMKLIEINEAGNKLKVSCVNDTTMQYFTSAADVRQQITRNLNTPDFYGDTVNLYKVK